MYPIFDFGPLGLAFLTFGIWIALSGSLLLLLERQFGGSLSRFVAFSMSTLLVGMILIDGVFWYGLVGCAGLTLLLYRSLIREKS